MLMVRKNQYCEYGHTAQSNLYIYCYPYQNTNGIIQINRKKSKIYVEPQKTQNNQSNPEQKEQSWKHHAT